MFGLGMFMMVLGFSVTINGRNVALMLSMSDSWLPAIVLLSFVLELVLVGVSYRLFKRMPVVSRKLF